MKFDVIASQWATEGQVFAGGTRDTDEEGIELTPELCSLLAAAADAGVVVIVEATDAEAALLEGHVQSQEDGLAAREAAVESGEWSESNVAQFELDVESGQRAASLALSAPEVSG